MVAFENVCPKEVHNRVRYRYTEHVSSVQLNVILYKTLVVRDSLLAMHLTYLYPDPPCCDDSSCLLDTE
jgi:hypothetical protein